MASLLLCILVNFTGLGLAHQMTVATIGPQVHHTGMCPCALRNVPPFFITCSAEKWGRHLAFSMYDNHSLLGRYLACSGPQLSLHAIKPF